MAGLRQSCSQVIDKGLDEVGVVPRQVLEFRVRTARVGIRSARVIHGQKIAAVQRAVVPVSNPSEKIVVKSGITKITNSTP